jgi:hypothetical protein
MASIIRVGRSEITGRQIADLRRSGVPLSGAQCPRNSEWYARFGATLLRLLPIPRNRRMDHRPSVDRRFRIPDSCRSNAFQAGPMGMTEKQEMGEKAIFDLLLQSSASHESRIRREYATGDRANPTYHRVCGPRRDRNSSRGWRAVRNSLYRT